MLIRRKSALMVAAFALTAPALTACGFDYATDRVYTPAAGANNRDMVVDVLGGVIVASQDNVGTFVATLSNNSAEDEITLETVGGDVTAEEVDPVAVAPHGLVNFADIDGIVVNGEFRAGNFVQVDLGFDNGETVEITVPVVTNCHDFEGLDISEPPAAAAESDAEAHDTNIYSCEWAAPAESEHG